MWSWATLACVWDDGGRLGAGAALLRLFWPDRLVEAGDGELSREHVLGTEDTPSSPSTDAAASTLATAALREPPPPRRLRELVDFGPLF